MLSSVLASFPLLIDFRNSGKRRACKLKSARTKTVLTKRFHSLSGKVDVDVDRFYTALFSALEQTHCVHVACDSE